MSIYFVHLIFYLTYYISIFSSGIYGTEDYYYLTDPMVIILLPSYHIVTPLIKLSNDHLPPDLQ